jgi:hypothetical protein
MVKNHLVAKETSSKVPFREGCGVHNKVKFINHAIKKEDMNIKKLESAVLKEIYPEVKELVRIRVNEIMEEKNHSSEECFRPEFIKHVRRVEQSEGKKFTNLKELEKYLS